MAGLLLGGYSQSGIAADHSNEFYFGVQIAEFTYEQDDVPDIEPTALVFRVGTMLNENLGVEARLGGGISEDDTDFDLLGRNSNLEIEIEHLIGVYGVARAPVGESGSIYGLIGFTSIEVDATLESPFVSGTGSEDESGLSFGVGADWGPSSDMFRISIEFMSYLDEDEFDATAVSLGLQF